MAQRKSSAKRGTSGKRRTSRKKSRKVKLNARAVFALSVTICVLSAAFLAFSFFTFANSDSSSKNSVAAEKIFSQKKQTAEPKSEKKSGTSVKTNTSEKKNQSQKTESSSSKTSTAEKKVQSQANETAVAKTNTVKNSSSETKSQSQKTESAATKNTAASSKTSAAEKKVQSQVKEQSSVKTNSTEIKNTDSHIASIGTVSAGDKELEEAKKKLFNIPPAVNGAKLCFVIDDAGENVANVKKYTALPFPVTIAVLPRVSHSAECAQIIRSAGKEVILHQPMQAVNLNMNPGEGAVKADMHLYEIEEIVLENIRRIGPVKGMNNHEGSLITSEVLKIGAVLEVCMAEGIYFIDSRTALAEANQVRQAALERNMNVLERNAPFIDNVITREDMLSEIYKGLAVANKQGRAIMIGHVDKSVNILPTLLSDLYPYLVKAGYVITTPSKLGL